MITVLIIMLVETILTYTETIEQCARKIRQRNNRAKLYVEKIKEDDIHVVDDTFAIFVQWEWCDADKIILCNKDGIYIEVLWIRNFIIVVKNVKKIKNFNFFRSLFTKYPFYYIIYSWTKELRKYRGQKSNFLAPKNLVLPCQKNFYLEINFFLNFLKINEIHKILLNHRF